MQVITVNTVRTGKPGAYEFSPPNKTLQLSDKEAHLLITRGIVVAMGAVTQNVESQSNERSYVIVDAIVDAIDDLPPEAYGKDGKPGVKAIEDILGQNVSASDRDKAWEAYQRLVDDGKTT
jgi:hypothetical protein